MTALGQEVGRRAAAGTLWGPDGRSVGTGELAGLGAAEAVGPDARVAVCLHDPLDVVTALAALDGRVAALMLLSHSFPPDTVRALMERAGCTHLVGDEPGALPLGAALGARRDGGVATEWLLTTSGTTGLPKVVPHTLKTLSRTVHRLALDPPPVWGLVYDPTRFAGLQVVLQALIGGGDLAMADTDAGIPAQVEALAAHGCTHLSATPTYWRRLLMVPGHERLRLRQATLGGEIADQGTLNALRAAFPAARVSHIYASTEAGVGFSVTDGSAGFPASYLDDAPGNVRLKVVDGILWLRPPQTRLAPGGAPGIEVDADGFVRSGDRVRREGDRVHFLGRENGLINIGGVKVYPEAVEAVIKAVPEVALVQVTAKRSPVTGSLVVAAVQLAPGADPAAARGAIQRACAERLEREAVPAVIRFVDHLATNAAGKLVRTGTGG